MQKNPIVLLILDGFGHSNDQKHNAIAKAKTPNWDSLNKEYPNTLINASESYVGLPSGQMGNSEVGHLNIGAGRIIHQDIERINSSIENKEFFSDPLLNQNFKSIKENNRNLGSIKDVIKENSFELHPEGCYEEYKFTFIEARKV